MTNPTPDFDRAAILDLIGFARGATTGVYIPLDFVRWLGSYESAAMLNQILYWRDVARAAGRDEFYKTAAQWRAELALTDRQVRTAIADVRRVGVSTVCRKDPAGKRALFYSVDPDAFLTALMSFRQYANVQNVHMQTDKTYISYNTENTNREYIDADVVVVSDDKPKRRKPTTTPPTVDELVAALGDWFAAQPGNARVDLRADVEHMIDHHRSNGRAFADWVAAARTWVRRSLNPPAGARGGAGRPGRATPRAPVDVRRNSDGSAFGTGAQVDDGGAAIIRSTLDRLARANGWAVPTGAQVDQAVAVRAQGGEDPVAFVATLTGAAPFARSVKELIATVDLGVAI